MKQVSLTAKQCSLSSQVSPPAENPGQFLEAWGQAKVNSSHIPILKKKKESVLYIIVLTH